MKRAQRQYSEEERAAALADVLIIGQGATAAKYDIPRSTLATWQQKYEIVQNSTLKKGRIGALAASYLEANLQALTAQAYVASQPDYINRQSAENLAVLHGVMADKSIRLLEALQHHDEPPQLPSS